jgi:hypothetical protein
VCGPIEPESPIAQNVTTFNPSSSRLRRCSSVEQLPHPFDTEIHECQFIGLGWRESNECRHAETPDKTAAVICAPSRDNHPALVPHAPAVAACDQMANIVGRAQLRWR